MSCNTDLSSAAVASGCPTASEAVFVMGVVGGNGPSLAGKRMLSDLVCWFSGTGTPEGVVSALRNSYYKDNSTGDVYIKSTAGVGNTGWINITGGAGSLTGDI